MLFRLIKRLEFYNNGHGNHLINNARALIYYSLYFEDEELLNHSILLLKYSVENFQCSLADKSKHVTFYDRRKPNTNQ